MENVEALAEEQENNTESKEEKKTQAQILVELASDMYLFYDEQGDSYAKVKVNDHNEVWPVRSSDLRLILLGRYLEKNENKVPGSQAMTDALTALEAKARIHGVQHKVHTRLAEYEDSIYLDLCNEDWQIVEINKKGWQVIDESPVFFKRSKTMQPLPTPINGGNIQDLKEFINYDTESDFKLIIAWLLSTFKEKSPFPILTIQGEQGSAKSTTTKVLRALIDPSSLPLRALPKEERDLAIAANNTWILAFDNLSGLSNAMSDALCKLSTGGGLATRKLYSDDEEAVFQIMRPSILNGIDDIAKRQDLLDRSIVITLPSISEDKRKDEKTFWKRFNKKKTSILGALCSIVSEALKELPNTKLQSKPRMADFSLWVTAAEKALKWEQGEFMAIYSGNRDEAIEQGIESDPFASAVVQLLKAEGNFTGNASQLIGEAGRFTDERTKKTNAWPTSRSVRNRLRRINPALKKKNILYVEWENKTHKTLKLEWVEETSSLSSYRHEVTNDNGLTDYDKKHDRHSNYDDRHLSSSNDDAVKLSSSNKASNIKVYGDAYDNYDDLGHESKSDDEDLLI